MTTSGDQKELFVKAKSIAEKNLRQCYFDGKILASLVNFSDFWARDTFWALPGVLEIGDAQVAKNCLELFLSYQKPDGNVPRKIALDWNIAKYVFKKSFCRRKPHPIFKGNIPLSNSKDENSLMIIAFEAYLQKTGDHNFASANYDLLKSAINWYGAKMKNGFVREYALSSWMDTVFKNGNILYTNALYCQALKSFSEIAKITGREKDQEIYEEKYEDFRERINNKFWNGKFYDDELGKHKHFDTAGNAAACFFEIAPQEKADAVFKKLKNIKKEKLLPTVDPPYPFWKISPAAYLLGIRKYQNGVSWLWIDLLAVGAMLKYGRRNEALKHFEEICRVIVKNGAVYETCWNDGQPFNKLLWKSAVPFAWASGLFLEVYEIIRKKCNNFENVTQIDNWYQN